MDSAGLQSGLIPAIILAIPSAWIEGNGVVRINDIRAKSGINEGSVVSEHISKRVHLLEPKTGETTPVSVLEIAVLRAGIVELERGGFFGVVGAARARLLGTDNNAVWGAIAQSHSNRLRRLEEYEKNPALYAEDFREASADIARQLIEGPIR
jgi:hypothetical protein